MKNLFIASILLSCSFLVKGQTISIGFHTAKPGESIQVNYSAPSDYPENAWIGIIPSNIPHGSESENDNYDLSYQYLKKQTMGSLRFVAPSKEGKYDFRMHDTDNNGKEIAFVTFEVTSNPVRQNTNTLNNQIEGVYNTDFKEMTLSVYGDRVTGTYKYMDGKIDGILQGNKLSGTWTQSNGKGRFEFVFNQDFSSFSGKWSYNKDTPSKKWNGNKISSNGVSGIYEPPVNSNSSSLIEGIYNTDFKEMTIGINGNRVTGTYKHMDGKIDGILEGNKLTGTWTQSNGKGRIEFVFNQDFTAFSGKWSYNNDDPTRKWDGRK